MVTLMLAISKDIRWQFVSCWARLFPTENNVFLIRQWYGTLCAFHPGLLTVKHAYIEHTYNKLTLIVNWFSFPVGFKHIVKQT